MKKLVAAACSLIIAVVAAIALPTPAHAVTYIGICNNPSSDASIQAYRTQSPFTEAVIAPGNCVTFNDTGGYAKVDTELIGDGVDIEKYRRQKNGGTWESWNCNGTQHASDPYSGSQNYTTYWVSEFVSPC